MMLEGCGSEDHRRRSIINSYDETTIWKKMKKKGRKRKEEKKGKIAWWIESYRWAGEYLRGWESESINRPYFSLVPSKRAVFKCYFFLFEGRVYVRFMCCPRNMIT